MSKKCRIRQFTDNGSVYIASRFAFVLSRLGIHKIEWFELLFLVDDTRSVHKYGLIKLEGNKYRTKARAER